MPVTSDSDVIYTVNGESRGYTNLSGLSLPEYGQHSTTFLKPLFKIGDSTNKAKIGTASIPLAQIYATNALTSGTHDIFKIDFTQTVAAASGYIKGIRCTMTSDVKTPGSFNAIKGIIDYSTSGHAHGDAAPLAAEMTMPNSSATRGAYYMLDLQLSAGASSSWGSAGPVSWIRAKALGTVTEIDDRAFFLEFTAFTGATGHMIGANENTVKCRIGTNTMYMVMSEYEDTLSIGLTGAKKTLVASVPEIAVWSTSALTSGTQDVVKIDYTHTAIATSGYVKGIRCTMTSNVRTPGSFNAIKGIIDYQTSGSAHGDAACLSSELIPPNSSLARGSLTCVEAQVVPGASAGWASAGPLSFMRCKLSGTATEWDTRGYFIDFQGLAEGSDKMIDNDGGDLASEGGIRCLMGTTPIWLLYTTTQPA